MLLLFHSYNSLTIKPLSHTIFEIHLVIYLQKKKLIQNIDYTNLITMHRQKVTKNGVGK